MDEDWHAFLLRAASALLIAFFLLARYGRRYRVPGLKLAHACCLAYAALTITVDLAIKHAADAYGGKFPFDPACAVVVVENLKLLVSILLFSINWVRTWRRKEEVLLPGLRDIAWLSVPAMIYALNNLIAFHAIRSSSLATFGMAKETMLIWNALIWTATFRRRISGVRWLAIGGIFLGCVLNQVPALLTSTLTWGIGWAFLSAFMTAAGAVATEYAMKQRAAIDINLQNSIIYVLCSSFVLLSLAVLRPSKVWSLEAFFDGFVPECWRVIFLNVLMGLTVSRILKYVDAVTKTIVAVLCGPAIIIAGAIAFHTQLTGLEILATLVVCICCGIYLREGPLVAPSAPQETGGVLQTGRFRVQCLGHQHPYA